MTAFLAILSAVLVGGADFLGGLASRTASARRVAALAQAAGLPLAFLLALVAPADRVTGGDAAWALASGVAVACGLACFYTAMGRGLISVVAPLAAVTGAAVPVFYALARGERPGAAASIGIVIALVAVVIVSIAPDDPRHAHLAITPDVVGLSILAGGCFGAFYVALSLISDDAGLWPVALERSTATLTLDAIAPTSHAARSPSLPGRTPHRRDRAARGACDGRAAARAAARPGGDRLGARVAQPRHDGAARRARLRERMPGCNSRRLPRPRRRAGPRAGNAGD